MAQRGDFKISIHAPRAGSDQGCTQSLCTAWYFNPRSPCGERRVGSVVITGVPFISIHAPRAGSDARTKNALCDTDDFNPRSPCGERQQYIVLLQAQSAIYTQSAILSIVNAIKGRRLLIEFGAKACGISCVLQIRTHKTSGSSTGIVSFEP